MRLFSRTPVIASAFFALFSSAPFATAQYPGVQGAVERQIQELEQKKTYAAGLVQKGDLAMSGQDYESAFAFYKSAVDTLPLGGTASEDVRQQALNGFCRAAFDLARQRVSEGRYEDARTTVDVILEERYNPDYAPALSLRSQLLAPTGFVDRGTLTPEHVAKIEEVKRLIQEAKGFEASGRYDLAFRRCEQALNLDKYNIAARRLMEQINNARANYAKAAYNESRSAMLTEVSKAWELPVTKFTEGPTSMIEQPAITARATEGIQEKLDRIIIPSIEFNDASLRVALDNLRRRAAELDTSEPDPAKRGINILIKKSPDEPDYPITFDATDLPLRAVLEYIASSAGMKIKVDPHAVVFVPMSESTDILLTKEYKVPPSFMQGAASNAASAPSLGAAASQAAIEARSFNAKNFLESQGVTFPEGASANYLPSSSRLIVKNTLPNLESVDALVEASIAERPTQVEIETKFLEVTQNNLNELGFDWLLGQFALAGGSGIYGGGGTEGFGRTISNPSYPLVNPATGLPIGASSGTSGPITAGNRGGAGGRFGTAIQVNAVDALLLGGAGVSGAAPGILSVAGVFTNPQFQVVLRALSQNKGVDLVSAPKVTTKSGMNAKIEIVREFIYPTQFDPPQLSANQGTTYSPVVPNTPSSWATKNTGITLEVVPTVGPDLYTIDLQLVPRVIEFDGFINYGSPVFATVEYISPLDIGLLARPSFTFEATPNTINQPVFSTREVETTVSVYDGETVVMGGLMREDVQKVQDKVPILGDIPLAGRLFRSNVDQHVKRNLIMFVTASLMDPAGQPIIQALDDDDVLTPEPDIPAMLGETLPDDPDSIALPQ